MDDAQATLLLTRPKSQSVQFLTECETLAGRRLSVVISPLMRIEHLDTQVDFSKYATLIFTSANGVAAADNLRGRRVVTVGSNTAFKAQQAGADAVFFGTDVDALIARSDEIKGPALHCRGVHTRGDLATRLCQSGIETDEAVLYDQVSQPLSQAAVALLESSGKVVAPLFSPRSARLLSTFKIAAQIQIIAMSRAVATAWTSTGDIDVVDPPTSDAMAIGTVRHF